MPPGLNPTCFEMAARLALSSHHPLAAAVAREARDRTPIEGAVEAPGQGVRAMIDGHEARLGSAAFCGIADPSGQLPAGDSGTSLIAFTHGDRKAVLAIRQSLRPDAIAAVKALKAQGYDIRIMSGDRAGSGGADRGGARNFSIGRPPSSRPTRSQRSTH